MTMSEAQKKAQTKYQEKRKHQDKINTIYLSEEEAEIAKKAFAKFPTRKAAVIAGLEKLVKK